MSDSLTTEFALDPAIGSAPFSSSDRKFRVDAGTSQIVPVRAQYLPLKHTVDRCLAFILLIPATPLILLAAIATRLSSKGPCFYWQTRLGQYGRPFRICKIRTMVLNAEAKTGAVWSQENDPRVTPLGRFLRKSHIDEFPQLFQVLAGHMSLVGPRPERPEFVQRLQWQVPGYSDRLNVKPGVTGLAQLMLPPDFDLDDVRRKVEHDLYYVEHLSAWLDLVILFHTAVLLGKTIVDAVLSPWRLPRTASVRQWVNEKEQFVGRSESAARVRI